MQHLLDPAILGSVIDWDAIDHALQVLEIRSQSHRSSKMVVQFHCLTYEWKEEVKRLKGTTGWLPRFERVGIIEFVSDEECHAREWKHDLSIVLCTDPLLVRVVSSSTSVWKSLR